nr:hypothetical protein CFP56_73757 [Quercus suber]
MDVAINRWLQDIPISSIVTPGSSSPQSCKRRSALVEMDRNPSTPAKRARKNDHAHASRTLVEQDDVGSASPRPLAPTSSAINGLQRSKESSSTVPSDSMSRALQPTTESQSSKRKRDSNPSKVLAKLSWLSYPVQQRTIGMPRDMPASLQPLVRTLRSIEKGRGIISVEHTVETRALLADEDDEDDWASVVSPSRATYGSCPTKIFAEKLVRRTMQNIEMGRSEAAWNCNVHFPLLAEACERSVYAQAVQCENITAATMGRDSSDTSRKVDFAITFNLEESTKAELCRRGIETLSHSSYQPLCYSPLAVSVETKLEGERGQEANLQLSVWAYGHARALQVLLHKVGQADVQIPALPLLLVQGGRWHFSYFEIGSASAVRWSQITIGDTSTIRGVYQVISALQRLIEWVELVYRPWFTESILLPLLELPRASA